MSKDKSKSINIVKMFYMGILCGPDFFMSSEHVQYGKNVTLFFYIIAICITSAHLTCYAARRNIVRNVYAMLTYILVICTYILVIFWYF
jgi:Cft2 family RNA processing exonuclease